MIHILVVDDDKNLNQTVCTYLNDCGFEAKGVLSANEAYDLSLIHIYLRRNGKRDDRIRFQSIIRRQCVQAL